MWIISCLASSIVYSYGSKSVCAVLVVCVDHRKYTVKRKTDLLSLFLLLTASYLNFFLIL